MARLLLTTALYALVAPGPSNADEPPKPQAGEVRLASGRTVEYALHFDRNSLRDSLRLDDSLIASTSSGALLRFELPAVRLVRERIDAAEVTCLGRGRVEEALAGLADGRVCRIDPRTLALTEVARLPEPPRWMGWAGATGDRPAGLVAVTRQARTVERDGRRWEEVRSVVHDLATGRRIALEDEATTFLLDGSGRLWLGSDRGEWGGRVTRVNLAGGAAAMVPPPLADNPHQKAYWEGVYGFVALRDGQVWAFGGTSHMGFNSGYVMRIDGAEPRPVFAQRPAQEIGREPDPARPRLPITQIVEEAGGLLVLSYSDVFRADRAMKEWKKVATLKIGYRWGRPDAVGAYPSVRVVHPPGREGEPYVLATVGDGYVLLEGAHSASRALPGQLGASYVSRVESVSEGVLAFDEDDRLPPWLLRAGAWEVAPFAPPFEPEPDLADFEKDQGGWYETRVLVGPTGSIFTVSGTGAIPGTRTTARRIAGKSVRLGRESSSLDPSSCFVTANGTLWNASQSNLSRFQGGRWKDVGRIPDGERMGQLHPIDAKGPPWLLVDRFDDALWRLAPGADGEDPRLDRIEASEGDQARKIAAALRQPDGSLLLATDAGLRGFDPAERTLSKIELGPLPGPVTAMARDGLGRLWLGTEHGLSLVRAGGKAIEPLDPVPEIGRGVITSVVPDPSREGGVILGLGARGLGTVRAGREP